MGLWDAYMRLSVGLLLFGMGIKSRNRTRSVLLMALGANKVAEGVTRYCPVLGLLDMDTMAPYERHETPGAVSGGYRPLAQHPYRTDDDDGVDDEENGRYAESGEGGPSRRRLRFRRPRHVLTKHSLGNGNANGR